MSGTDQSKWYCSLPWTGFSNDPDGKVRPCCLHKGYITQEDGSPYYVQTQSVKEIFASKYMKDLRQEFRNGAKPVGCEICIKDESNGYKSKRQTYQTDNVEFDQEPYLPIEYQMILSNACNLKCRSCTPSHSSQWQAEHKIIWGNTGYNMPHGQSGDKDSVLWSTRHEWMSFVQRLEIVGGEPFYIKQWRDLWKELITTGYSKNIAMSMSSNATIYSGDVVVDLAKHFKFIGLGLSIDGMGAMYEYLRHPGKWDEVKQNLLQYNELKNDPANSVLGLSYTYTIGWLNAWQLLEFHTWVKENTPNIRIWNNIIHNPKHMSIVSIPLRVKEQIAARWGTHNWGEYENDIAGIIKFMFSEQPTDDELRRLYTTFSKNDAIRNENIRNIIPAEFKSSIEFLIS